jgi:hypothetical protein
MESAKMVATQKWPNYAIMELIVPIVDLVAFVSPVVISNPIRCVLTSMKKEWYTIAQLQWFQSQFSHPMLGVPTQPVQNKIVASTQ